MVQEVTSESDHPWWVGVDVVWKVHLGLVVCKGTVISISALAFVGCPENAKHFV